MSSNKTIPTQASVADFLSKVEDEQKLSDCKVLLKMMKEVTGHKPVMWGPSIIGFGSYHYKYDTGREGDMLMVGFSPRKQALSLYIMGGFERYETLMARLGKFKTGKSCLYIKQLDDVDLSVLRELISASYEHIHNKYNS